jgi:radical SAM superfamily enzyme YgiQ (UPF0313 family)
MRILFLYPNVGTRNGTHYPHGIGALAAAAASAGHEVAVRLPETVPTADAWRADLADWRPELLACGFSSHQWPIARALMQQARDAGVRVVAGGVHASFAADEVLASGAVDFVCVGEGEGALLDVAAGLDPRGIANLRGADFALPLRPLRDDLKRDAPYDRRHFPMAEIGRVNGHEMAVAVGRGCPYPCTYCCNGAWRRLYPGQKWVRLRAVDHVFAEMDLLASRHRVDSFYFEDDIFTLDRAFLDAFLTEYPRHFDVPFRCYLRIGDVSFDDLHRLKDAGLRLANVGVEHGDPGIREQTMGRRMSNGAIAEFFDDCRGLGIATRAFHIVGVPDETPATCRATVELCERVTPDQVQVSLFEPYPGTALHERCRREGLIRGVARRSYFDDEPALDLPHFPPAELQAAYRAFCARVPEIEALALSRAIAAQTRGDIDLLGEWSPARVEQHGAEPVDRRRACLGRDERFALFAHPRSIVAYDLPAGDYRLSAGLGFDPICFDWGGGAARFVVTLDETVLLDQRLHPREVRGGWRDVEVAVPAARRGVLRLQTLPADSDDLTGLWTVWGHPHLWRSGAR